MNGFYAALWAETLKARRSKVPILTTVAFMIIPLVGGLFRLAATRKRFHSARMGNHKDFEL